jgi:exonuclease III
VKIITWNCNGALRKKFTHLLNLNADIYVVQECENPAEIADKEYKKWAGNYLWIGDSKNKGLGIFANNNIEISKLTWSNSYKDHILKHFLPCSVNGAFDLLAVWTHQNNSPNFGYIGQFWKYLQINKEKFKNTIIIGDFNSNTVWDEWDRWWNHSDVVKELQEIGLESLYHKFNNELQGKESQPTFYLHRKMTKPYHIDYCFAPIKISEKLKDFKIGKYDDWKHLSDHLPIIITLS